MSIALKQQARDELQRQFADLFARRGELAAQRSGAADAAVVNEQIKRLDADLQTLSRDLASAERALKVAT
jgi:hypothetical protein